MRHLVCLNFPSSIGFNQCSSATILVSFSVHFCLGRKKEIINLYCNPLSIATIFFPRREGGLEWKGTCHVFQHSLHEGDYCGAQPCLSISRLKKDRQMEYPALENFWLVFLINFPKSSRSHFLNYEVSMMSQRMRGWGRGVQVPLVTPLVNNDVKVFPT